MVLYTASMNCTSERLRILSLADCRPPSMCAVASLLMLILCLPCILADAKTLPGVTAPFDNVFDPAGFLATASVKDVRRWRESEITHGRVAMLAALGFIVGEQLQDFPLFFSEFGVLAAGTKNAAHGPYQCRSSCPLVPPPRPRIAYPSVAHG